MRYTNVILVDIVVGMLMLLMVACIPISAPSAPAVSSHTVADTSHHAFERAQPALSEDQLGMFAKGKAEFAQRWVPFPSIGGQWGRGPLFNAESCESCHARNGRGNIDESIEEGPAALLLSFGATDGKGFDPVYGQQLNTRGVLGRVPAEGRLRVRWREQRVVLLDGHSVALRSPRVEVQDLGYGPLAESTRMSLRIAPQLVGLGLLEGVDAEEMERVRESQRVSGHEGRINRTLDLATGTHAMGRFGWKATQPNLRQQVAHAFIEDIGVTTSLFMQEHCSNAQTECARTQTVVHPEAKDEQLDALTAYLRGLAVPLPRTPDGRGARVFRKLQCDRCHVRSLRTSTPTPVTITPYSDLMLHDMGRSLADEVSEYDARGSDWRTPPLWGLGLLATVSGGEQLLHDGRARNVEEAILWHDGQARRSRDDYTRLSREDRASLLRFLHSI